MLKITTGCGGGDKEGQGGGGISDSRREPSQPSKPHNGEGGTN